MHDSPYPDGVVPWGYRKSFTLDPLESHFFRIRDLEHKVLRLQRELGQIEDEIPELLAGDLLEPEQAVLFEVQSRLPITAEALLAQSEKWVAAGRQPYPISEWVAEGTSIQGKGEYVISDAVIRVVRNYAWPELAVEGMPRISRLEFHPLQWERSHLSSRELEKASFTAKPGDDVELRYELGRAYGIDGKSFGAILLTALMSIMEEAKELADLGFHVNAITLEAHAGSVTTADYYRSLFGFKPKPGVIQRNDHWVLTGNIYGLYDGLRKRFPTLSAIQPD